VALANHKTETEMNKPIKVTLLCIIGIPLIILSVLLCVFLFKDANDFKSTIEEQAKAQIGLNLKIEDKLSWSLIPIGIEVNKLSILDQSEAPFASADKIVASIDFWSLFKGSPKVETILLDGLKLELIQVSDTENNWSKILPPKSEEQSESLTTKAPQTETESDGEKSPLNFLIESFQLINTGIRFESIPHAIQLEIKHLNLSLSQITLGETFPLTVSYSLSEAKNQINIDSILKANLFASKDLTKFTLSNLQNSYEVNAPNISSKTINLNLASNLDIDTKAESVDISSLMISLNNLTLKGQAEIRNYSKDLSLNSEIDIPNFSLKGLLSSLSISLPEMQNKETLESVSLSSSIRLENKSLNLKDILINLDKSSWKADVSHSLESTASKIRIKGDKINLDSYLPPTKDKEANDSDIEGKNTEAVKTETNQPLLPIETLQKLNLDFELEQDSISVKNIETTKLVVALFAKDGKLTQTLKGNLFEGSYSSKSTIDVHSKKPLWASEQSIKDLNLAPIFDTLNIEVLKEYGNIAGLLNLSAKTNMSGNDLNTLKSSATSDLEFHIDQGSFEGLSLNALVCKGFALINKEAVDTSTWPNTTPFNTLKGSASLKQQILDTRFDIITSGIHADSKGSIDISKNNINILASLKVIGDLGDNACRVNKKVTKIGIPVKCQGEFDTPPAELCKLDTSRLGDMAKDLAIEEGTRKAKKEIDRALDKHLGDKKEALKSIFNKFLK
jgi:AsmA protein